MLLLLSLCSRSCYRLRCCSAVAPLLLRCCSAVALLLLRCCSAIVLLSVRRHSAVATLSLRCCSAVTPLHCLSAVAPLSLCCRFCRFLAAAVAVAVAAAVATLSLLLLLLLSLHCHSRRRSGVAMVLLRYRSVISPPSIRCCYAATAVTLAVAPAITTAVTPLLLLELFTFVASRCRIRVTVSIGDCQARVSSSSEGYSTS